MWIFSTREIAIFIYIMLFIVYGLLHKKLRDSVCTLIKTACNIKLVVPFLIILLFSSVFTWGCTYLSFWNWAYVKDIVFWTLFVGVPICFNAVSSKVEESYFKNIIIDNLKFTALVEFITGTFTFHIIGELILQPFLFFFIILQSSLVKKTDATKKFVDGLVAISGLIILGFTVKSAIDSIGEMQFVDIMVGLLLPLILSILYLPVAYFFAVYAKYEILFLRMGYKEPNNKKLKFKRRIKTILVCKFSYSKICKFLDEYVKRMYVSMEEADFEKILKDFKMQYNQINSLRGK